MINRVNKRKRCHPERLKKNEVFRRESKDLRTDLTANVWPVRRFFDALRLLRMTNLSDCAFSVLLSQVDTDIIVYPAKKGNPRQNWPGMGRGWIIL